PCLTFRREIPCQMTVEIHYANGNSNGLDTLATQISTFEQSDCGGLNGRGIEIVQASVVTFRADGPLARPARYRVMEVEGLGVICQGAFDVRRAEQGDHRDVESSREVSRSRVRRHEERRASDTRLGQPDA